MRSKADETLVIIETLICPLQISQVTFNPSSGKSIARPNLKRQSLHMLVNSSKSLQQS